MIQQRAEEDLDRAIQYYNNQQAGLGELFFQEIKETIDYISKHPLSFAIRYNNVRIGILARYSFLVQYVVVEKVVIIMAFTHSSRNPENWPKK
ncbi:MAG: type II toxin-antitoxin system RelE/ParE family toxin [Flavobacteriales bacterium]|nr:type II toxin-antitoxin system RelE/ParE family toxin [Flavobacteriales bacterium]